MFHELKLDALVVIGGDGTLAIAHQFHKRGIPIVGVPKTIDNDIVETTNTFGFDTAVSFATDAIDRLHTTAEAHHRVMVVEVMGRYAGWIALYAGVAGGADVILIPEIPFDIEKVARRDPRPRRMGARFSIVVVAEGARPIGGNDRRPEGGRRRVVERLGGMGARVVTRARKPDRQGDPQRRARAPPAGRRADELRPRSWRRASAPAPSNCCCDGQFGQMVAFHPPDIVAVPLEKIVGRTRTVPIGFRRRPHRARGIGDTSLRGLQEAERSWTRTPAPERRPGISARRPVLNTTTVSEGFMRRVLQQHLERAEAPRRLRARR